MCKLIAIVVSALWSVWTQSVVGSYSPFILSDSTLQSYITQFNTDDNELYPQHIPNRDAFAFLRENIPLFVCPDKDIERTYYFRWWTYRKHIKFVDSGARRSELAKYPKVPVNMPGAIASATVGADANQSFYVITEFLPKVSWSGLYNTISCAAGHHFRGTYGCRIVTCVRQLLVVY
jgi:hypothetical protein